MSFLIFYLLGVASMNAQTVHEPLHCAQDKLTDALSETYRQKIVTHAQLAGFIRYGNRTDFREVMLNNVELWTDLVEEYSDYLWKIENVLTEAALAAPTLTSASYRNDLQACTEPARDVINQRIDAIEAEEDLIGNGSEDFCSVDEYNTLHYPDELVDAFIAYYEDQTSVLITYTEAQDATTEALQCIEDVKNAFLAN